MDVTVEAFCPHTAEQKHAKKIIASYIETLTENLSQGRGVTLWGGVGAGKTHLAACIVLAAKTQKNRPQLSAYFATEDGIFDRFKKEWGDPEEEIRFLTQLQKVRFLVIDDMGIRRPSDYVSDRYEAIINTRYANGLPTIITTNRPPDQLAEVYERQMSRLSGNIVLKIVGPDMRGRQ